MNSFKWRFPLLLTAAVIVIAALIWFGLQIGNWQQDASIRSVTKGEPLVFDKPAGVKQALAELPDEGRFRKVAETAALQLLVDSDTAHFQIVNRATGAVWRSYPDPDRWADEKIGGTWKNNLLSPVIVEYANISNYKSASKTVGLIDEGGYVENFQTTDTGFRATLVLPAGQFKIPVEVNLQDDYVETAIIDEGIVEGSFSLLNAKLYPLFGAQFTTEQEGYLFVPDGSGALIHFKESRIMPQLTYNQSIYGYDASFYREHLDRQRISLPVFGLKSGEQAFAAVVTEGTEFANVFAAPSGSVGSSNWVTAEWQYRKRFFQSVSKSGEQGFFTYSAKKFTAPRRAIRYYPLTPEESNYAGMAQAYRHYLIGEHDLQRLAVTSDEVPLYLDIVGGDIEKGLLFDSYKTATPTSEAIQLVQDVYDAGVRNVTVQYTGWQQDGYSTHGGYFPVEAEIGGNKGMKQFVDYAHSLNIPVYLTANYTINNNGDDGFWSRRDGQRDLAGNVLEHWIGNQDDASYQVSAGFYKKVLSSDLKRYKELGVDGINFEEGIGSQLNTDFNSRYSASRGDVIDVQREILAQTRETLGAVNVTNGSAYVWDQVKHIHRLADDYSYDIFIDEAVPFSQIVLHGLVTYTSNWSNLRNESRTEFLRSIEYGAYPAYVFSSEASDKLKRVYSVWYYSMNAQQWLASLTEEYKAVNAALGAVQNKFIVGHRTLAPNVKETTYEDSYRVIVNYNSSDYRDGELSVPAHDFVVIEGEDTR
ncbi:hypothetical protein EBB07_10500 [Paenibacillaceae bacterium]|nr:hypothetical protein EBB07_10500 [Paenibacillaceae bacterium]